MGPAPARRRRLPLPRNRSGRTSTSRDARGAWRRWPTTTTGTRSWDARSGRTSSRPVRATVRVGERRRARRRRRRLRPRRWGPARRRRVVVARGATEGERVQAARGSRQRVRGRVMNGGVAVASALWNESRVYTKRCKRCRRRRRCRVVIIYVQRSPFLISVSLPPECHPRTCSPRPPAPARTPPPRRRRLAGPGEGSAATAGAGAAARRT